MSTKVISNGSEGNLRLVIPYMITAMKAYLGANSSGTVEVVTAKDDPAVQALLSSAITTVK